MGNGNVVVSMPVNAVQRQKLELAAPKRNFIYTSYETVSKDLMENAEIIIGSFPWDLLKETNSLKLCQLQTCGADDILSSNFLPESAVITNARGAFSESQAEFMLASLLTLMKKLPEYHDNKAKHIWADCGVEKTILGSRALIIGLGSIGGSFSRKLRALGAYTVGITRSGKMKEPIADECYSLNALSEQLALSDIVVLVLPFTGETDCLFGAEQFNSMKTGSIFMNMGRGKTVDTHALCNTLKSGKLYGACLDVTSPEPLPKDHMLWDFPRLIITPHIAGRDYLPCVLEKTVDIAVNNLYAYENGKPLINIIDRKLGYNI